MITKIKIDGYKSFRDFELEMKPLMVIFGPNASGKSNLFDAINLIGLAATEKNLKIAFEKHRGLPRESLFSGGLPTGASRLMTFEVDAALGENVCASVESQIQNLRAGLDQSGAPKKITERNLRYYFQLEIMEPSFEPRIVDEKLTALTKRDPHRERSRKAFLEKEEGKMTLRMEGQSHPFKKDVGLTSSIVSSPLYPPHHPHISAFREEAERWRFFYFEPKSLMRADIPLKDLEQIGPRGEDLSAFLFTLKHKQPRNFENLARTMHLLIPQIKDLDVVQLKDEGRVRLMVKEAQGRFSPALISEGTMRLIGLLAVTHALKPYSLVCYEEPENGVHPERLKLIADQLKNFSKHSKTQVIINTHSPELVDHFDDSCLFVCSKKEGITRIEPLGKGTPLFRKQLIKESLMDPSQ